MGCDIHGAIEVDEVGRNYWIGVIDLNFMDRNYDLFSLLAGVRDYVEAIPIAERRGLPDKPSRMIKENYETWAGDAHSATWMTLKEIKEYDYSQEFEDTRVSEVLEDGTVLTKCFSHYMDGKTLEEGDKYFV